MMRAVLVAVAWADIILCAMARALVLLLPALAVALTVVMIRKRGEALMPWEIIIVVALIFLVMSKA